MSSMRKIYVCYNACKNVRTLNFLPYIQLMTLYSNEFASHVRMLGLLHSSPMLCIFLSILNIYCYNNHYTVQLVRSSERDFVNFQVLSTAVLLIGSLSGQTRHSSQ